MAGELTDPVSARLVFITEPERGVFLLNVQLTSEGKLHRIELTRNQLAGMVVRGADVLLRTGGANG